MPNRSPALGPCPQLHLLSALLLVQSSHSSSSPAPYLPRYASGQSRPDQHALPHVAAFSPNRCPPLLRPPRLAIGLASGDGRPCVHPTASGRLNQTKPFKPPEPHPPIQGPCLLSGKPPPPPLFSLFAAAYLTGHLPLCAGP
jgi:hypothetical protein